MGKLVKCSQTTEREIVIKIEKYNFKLCLRRKILFFNEGISLCYDNLALALSCTNVSPMFSNNFPLLWSHNNSVKYIFALNSWDLRPQTQRLSQIGWWLVRNGCFDVSWGCL